MARGITAQLDECANLPFPNSLTLTRGSGAGALGAAGGMGVSGGRQPCGP